MQNADLRWFPHYKSLLILLGLLLCNPPNSTAFKLKTHVLIANDASASISKAESGYFIDIGEFKKVPLHNDEVAEALAKYPKFYRAGTLGPDVFPDLIAGQLWVHVNKGNESNLSDSDCKLRGSECVLSNVSFENRKFGQWRSIDYGMFILKKAKEYRSAGVKADRQEHLKAIAFAYGYLAHMVGDGFAHTYVNEIVRSYFNYLQGNAGALYGPPTEEIQHMAVEGYIDIHMPKPANVDQFEIEVPHEFLNALYRSSPPSGNAMALSGSIGGEYYVKMLELSRRLHILSKHENWVSTNKIPGWTQDLIDLSVRINNIGTQLATLGTDIGNPIRDIEDYFFRRHIMIETLIDKWVFLSGCIAQNILNGSDKGPSEIVAVDACNEGVMRNVEDDSLVRDIFQGELNKAVHFEEGQAGYDFGRVASNVRKQEQYIRSIVARALVFQPWEDIRSLRELKRMIDTCDRRILDWDSCDEACSVAGKVCTKLVVKSACLTCPKKDNKYSCSGTRRLLCVAQPHCFACAENAFKQVTDAACTANVNAAAPVCEACSSNTLCAHLRLVKEFHDALNELLRKAIDQVVDSIVEQVKRKLMETYAGRYVKDFIDLYKEFEKRQQAKAAWFVNIAFLREDLAKDPTYLNQVLQRIIRTSGQFARNGPAAEAARMAATETRAEGIGALQSKINVSGSTTYEDVWRGLVNLLFRIERDPAFLMTRDLNIPEHNWLSQISFRRVGLSYDTRLGTFVGLLAELDAFAGIRGPTARELSESMGVRADAADSDSATLNKDVFYPVQNAFQLTKLSYLGEQGVKFLLKAALDPARLRNLGRIIPGNSDICQETFNILCDSIQSLDDPNHYRISLPLTTIIPGARSTDSGRSFAVWSSPTHQPEECVIGLTDFYLAADADTLQKVYNRVFKYPPRCNGPDLAVKEASVTPGTSTARSFIIRATTQNVGTLDSPPSKIIIDIGDDSPLVSDVPALKSWELHLTELEAVISPNTRFVTITVDGQQEIRETNESNNEAKRKLHP